VKYKDIQKTDIDYINSIYPDISQSWDSRMLTLQNYFQVSERTVRKWIKKLGIKKSEEEEKSEEYNLAKKRKLSKNQHYIFSWAQNATPIHEEMLKNVEAYAKYLKADIHVIAGRYKNPTSTFSEAQKKQDYWNKDIVKYLDANRHKIHPELTVLADLKTQPTATYPVSGLAGLSKGGSIIVGHPKIHLQPFPVLKGDNPKFAISTGSITHPNYTDSTAGKKGEFFHMYGFTIVEIEGDEYYFRQVPVCDDGSFIDLDVEVKNQTITPIKEIEAIVFGDVHLSEIDKDIEKNTFSFLDKINPKATILHDLFNGQSIRHHDKKKPILLYEKYIKGQDILEDEISEMLDWLKSKEKYNLVVVSANHNDWLDKWIDSDDWRTDIKNSLWYSRLLTAALEGKAPDGLINYLIDLNTDNKVKTLGRDESFKVKDYELAYHGDQGQNGSKGNLKQFSRLNTKVIVGDYHSGARIDGAIGVGTMTPLRVGYNKGASSWNNSHAIIHSNGKVQQLIFKKNKRFSKRYK
jgi:hypothetical protein